ncbi:MAG: DNA-deoxyinosine glycosylase [Clostridiales bacterium]|nr:DNA-deoxyinosine glycosylase [Clostridiales bacterium]
MRITGFPPFFNEDSEILILGSFPSVKSREEGFYYGNKQNRFWRALAKALNKSVPISVEEKKELLASSKIAIWDIVTECEIKGSSDESIKNAKVADLNIILNRAKIKRILLNGLTAYKYFIKYYPRLKDISYLLPSTSPRNAKFKEETFIEIINKAIKE